VTFQAIHPSVLDQKRSNASDYAGGKPSKNRDSQQASKSKQQQQASASKEPKTILSAKSNTEEPASVDNAPKGEMRSAEASSTSASVNENTQSGERPRSSNKAPSGGMQKVGTRSYRWEIWSQQFVLLRIQMLHRRIGHPCKSIIQQNELDYENNRIHLLKKRTFLCLFCAINDYTLHPSSVLLLLSDLAEINVRTSISLK
jgi:hypothetical protein